MKLRTAAVVSMVALSSAAATTAVQAGTITYGVGYTGGASIYANPFDTILPNFNITPAETVVTFGDPSTGSPDVNGDTFPDWVEHIPLVNAVNRRDSASYVEYGAYLNRPGDGGTGSPAYMQFRTPTSTFNVGTVITAQALNHPFTGTNPYTIKFAQDPNPSDQTTGAWSSVPVFVNGLDKGQPQTHLINVTTGNSLVTGADTMRIQFPSTVVAGTSQALMQEVVVLPERLVQVPVTVDTSATTGNGFKTNLADGKGNPTDMWYDLSGATAAAELSFAETEVDALVFFVWHEYWGQKLTVIDDITGNKLFDVQFESGTSTTANIPGAEVLPIHLDTPVTTSRLRFEWLNGSPRDGVASIREIIVLTDAPALPEPSAVSVLAVSALFLRRVRRDRTH